MRFHIAPVELQRIIFYCREQLPHEACGFLMGSEASDKPGQWQVHSFVPAANRSPRPEHHFDMEPRDLIPWLLHTASGGSDQLVGLVHSHPQAPPLPSSEDLRTPWYQVPSHWIVSFTDPRQPQVMAYSYQKDKDGQIRYHSLLVQH
ncbi:Mov34/MPN/PAD-1 family protein [Paenibacillus cremeus]|uniref:JAB domain-containing protein n=1 Tax=Paenibacillus cremeus TaxID=2163881 RepID=A0A559K805_9BACL|nr:Mov34/MPN/PAD-1 family protein [Paenibacillus cremeus]TVY08261.1 hypothetical protein FPZ49_19520 [Paenibacillus cremeus]